MGLDEQLRKIEDLYSSNLKKLGVASKAVGWNTTECQKLRFVKLSTVLSNHTEEVSINDYGCGYGALLLFLINDLGLNVGQYNGYDISDAMLRAASVELKDYPGQLNLIQSKDVQTEADYSFVSGTFNVRFDAEERAWKQFIRNKLQELNNFSKRGFAFNLLTTYVDWKEPHLYYGDPCYWFDYCKINFSKRVSLLHDYPLYEWTILVKKDEE
jgi:SAM-dependent methyltransferase